MTAWCKRAVYGLSTACLLAESAHLFNRVMYSSDSGVSSFDDFKEDLRRSIKAGCSPPSAGFPGNASPIITRGENESFRQSQPSGKVEMQAAQQRKRLFQNYSQQQAIKHKKRRELENGLCISRSSGRVRAATQSKEWTNSRE